MEVVIKSASNNATPFEAVGETSVVVLNAPFAVASASQIQLSPVVIALDVQPFSPPLKSPSPVLFPQSTTSGMPFDGFSCTIILNVPAFSKKTFCQL